MIWINARWITGQQNGDTNVATVPHSQKATLNMPIVTPTVWWAWSRQIVVYLGCCLLFIIIASQTLAADYPSQTQRQVTVGFLKSFPPYYQLDENGNPSGFAADVMNEIAKRSGLTVTYRVKETWGEINKALETGEIDIIPNYGITALRKNYAAYTVPVDTFRISIFVRDDTHDVDDIGDLSGRPVAVLLDNAAHRILETHDEYQLRIFVDISTALFALLSGDVDAFVYPEAVTWKLAREAKIGRHIKVVGEPLKEIKRGMAVHKENVDLLAVLNPAVKSFLASPEYREVYVAWFGKPDPFWSVQRVVLALVTLAILLLTVMGAWRYYSVMRLGQALAERERRYKNLFDSAEISIWNEDFSEVVKVLNLLRKNGVSDLRGYLGENVQAAKDMATMVKVNDVNKATLRLFNVKSKKEFMGCADKLFGPGAIDLFIDKLCAIWDKKKNFRSEVALETFSGEELITVLSMPIPEAEEGFRNVPVSNLDITERKRAEAAIKRERDRTSEYLEIAEAMIVAIDFAGTVTLINRRGCEVLGYAEDEIVGRNWFDTVIPEDQREKMRSVHDKIVAGELESVEYFENVIYTKGRERRFIAWHNVVVRDEGGAIAGSLSSGQDITERKQLEEDLRESEGRYARAVAGTNDGLWDWNIQTNEDYFSPRWCEILGYEVGELKPEFQTSMDLLHPDDREAMTEAIRTHLEERVPYDIEYRRRHKNGEYIWVHARGQAEWNDQGEPIRMAGTLTDISDRKNAADKIKAALAEKEILLREIHHRVKNNLQVVSSMLSLQAGTDTGDRSTDALKEAQRRVKVMARIHENIYRSDDLASINARDYLNPVVEDTIASSGNGAQSISFHLEIGDVVLDIDHAIACGQIVSELLSNSLKHAFHNGQSGKIEVALHRRDGGDFELIVADDGMGLPEDFDLTCAESLGMRMVHALAMRLSGEVNVDGSGGTRVQIIFPEKPS